MYIILHFKNNWLNFKLLKKCNNHIKMMYAFALYSFNKNIILIEKFIVWFETSLVFLFLQSCIKIKKIYYSYLEIKFRPIQKRYSRTPA